MSKKSEKNVLKLERSVVCGKKYKTTCNRREKEAIIASEYI